MNAIYNQDYPLIQGCFAIIAVCVVAMNLLADLIYPLLDPRVALS
jgi:peptide/nickel transport system permease protein